VETYSHQRGSEEERKKGGGEDKRRPTRGSKKRILTSTTIVSPLEKMEGRKVQNSIKRSTGEGRKQDFRTG